MCLNQSKKENVKLSVRLRWAIQLDKVIVAITFTVIIIRRTIHARQLDTGELMTRSGKTTSKAD